MFYPNKKGMNRPKTISRYCPFMDELTFNNGEKLQLSMDSSSPWNHPQNTKASPFIFLFWAIFLPSWMRIPNPDPQIQ
jgi:hypothetical protein